MMSSTVVREGSVYKFGALNISETDSPPRIGEFPNMLASLGKIPMWANL